MVFYRKLACDRHRDRPRTTPLDKRPDLPISPSHESLAPDTSLIPSGGALAHPRTPDWSIPFTLGAPLSPIADMLIPEPSHEFTADFDDELAATRAPARTSSIALEERGHGAWAAGDLDVPSRTRIVPTTRRRTLPRPANMRDAGMTFDYPLSEPSLWPDAFDPEYARRFSRKPAAVDHAAAEAAAPPLPRPSWVQRHRVGLVIGFGIVPFVAVPLVALLGTRSARLVADLQVPQMSFFLDWVIVGAVTTVAATVIGMRYVSRRRTAAAPAQAGNYEPVGQES
jgi:hypothetical protein